MPVELDITQLIQPQTKDEVETDLLGIATTLGLSVTSWPVGGVARTILATLATAAATLTNSIAIIASSGFRTLASGAGLAMLAKSTFGVEKIEEESGESTLDLANASPTVYTIAAGDLHFAHGTTGKTYTNTSGGTLGASGTLTVDIIADEPGTASNAGDNDITVMVTPLLGVTITGNETLVGIDEETDTALSGRCLSKLGSLSPNGPRAAYDYVARTTAVPVFRTKTVEDKATGTTTLFIAGITSGEGAEAVADFFDAPAISTVDDAIQQNCVPVSITAITDTARVLPVTIHATVYVYNSANLTQGDVGGDEPDDPIEESLAYQAIEAYFNSVPIGGETDGSSGFIVAKEHISAAIRSISSKVALVTVSLPVSDLAVASDQIPVIKDTEFIVTYEGVADP